MEVILRQDIAKVGKAGQVIEVKDGYGRNFLIPRGLAYPATESHKRQVAADAKRRTAQAAATRAEAEELAQKLATTDLTFTAKTGEGDRLFGSITSADIAGKLAEMGFVVDKRDVELPEPIKMIGVSKVTIRLHPDVRPEVRVWVVKAE